MAHDVFLSYQSEDKLAADRLCAGLESRGINCWIAPRNIPVGTEWPTAIVEAIGACKAFVVILSSHSKNAKQISREAELADKQGCQIITFRIENVEPPSGLNYFLGNIQWIDAFGDQFDSAVAQVAQGIKKTPGGPDAAPPPVSVRTHEPASSRDGGRSDSGKRTPNKSISPISIVAVIAAVCIGAGIWFAWPHQPKSKAMPGANTADQMSQAEAVADRYLNERRTGKLDAAWAEISDTLQKNVDKVKWLDNQELLQQHAPVPDKLNGCTPAGNGYNCDYTLTRGNRAAGPDKMWLFRMHLVRESDAGWKISRFELHPIS